MRLATIRTPDGTRAVRVDAGRYVDLDAHDLGAWLARQIPAEHAQGRSYSLDADLATLIPNPSKVVCVGLNYRSHILEMGRDLPQHPTLFAKFADALIGAGDPIVLGSDSDQVDWEAELTIVIGSTVRRADEARAAAAIAGFTIMNDISMRDWQFRTREWLQGKTFEGTTPVGPNLVTPDELPGGVRPRLRISTSVNGVVMQESNTADLLFDPVALVQYVSRITTLRPGDLIATGTPGGVGHARDPQVFLREGDTVVTEIEHIGKLHNVVSGT